MAEWLDAAFHGFDYTVLAALHDFALATHDGLGWFFRLVSVLALNGFGLLIPGFVLLFFKRTRKIGAAMLGAVIIGAIFTNLAIKPLVDRARPFTHDEIRAWWQYVGSWPETEGSFPSGHTTATTAALLALLLTLRKKYAWFALFALPVMGISRMYLMVHYPTDILGGILSGGIAALCAVLVVKGVWHLLETHAEARFSKFVLSFDPIFDAIRRVGAKKATAGAETDTADAAADDTAATDDTDTEK